jgi:hypothetical protein
MLPIEIVYEILSYLRWKQRTGLICRDWLFKSLKKRVRLKKWKSKLKIYSYLKTFGCFSVHQSWSNFCIRHLGVCRRSRDIHYRLTWKAAAKKYMKKRCKCCGNYSNSNVFGIVICTRCRFNRKFKYSYMVTTTHALRIGMTRKVIKNVCYHKYGQARLRFLHELNIEMRNNS